LAAQLLGIATRTIYRKLAEVDAEAGLPEEELSEPASATELTPAAGQIGTATPLGLVGNR
jgi:hypothetical protein